MGCRISVEKGLDRTQTETCYGSFCREIKVNSGPYLGRLKVSGKGKGDKIRVEIMPGGPFLRTDGESVSAALLKNRVLQPTSCVVYVLPDMTINIEVDAS